MGTRGRWGGGGGGAATYLTLSPFSRSFALVMMGCVCSAGGVKREERMSGGRAREVRGPASVRPRAEVDLGRSTRLTHFESIVRFEGHGFGQLVDNDDVAPFER